MNSMRSVVEDLYAGFPVFQFIGNQQFIDWWINFDKQIVEQETTVNRMFCFRKNTIHNRLLECVLEAFFTKILKTVIPGNRYITGIRTGGHEIAAFETV